MDTVDPEHSADVPSAAVCFWCRQPYVLPNLNGVSIPTDGYGSVLIPARCGNCGWECKIEFYWNAAAAFDLWYEETLLAMRQVADKLGVEVLEEQLTSFIVAIQTDLLGPDDF